MVLQELRRGGKPNPKAALNHSQFFPEPRIKLGQWLGQRGSASAMIDLSDGLSTDLTHLCVESGASAVIRQESLPIARNARGGKSENLEALDWGEDYELLFTAGVKAKIPNNIAGVPVSRIGEMVPAKGKPKVMIMTTGGGLRELKPRGWQHFRKPG